MEPIPRRDLFKAAGLAGGAAVLGSAPMLAHPAPAEARAAVERVEVFKRLEGDYHTYRVPHPLLTDSGTLLMFAAGKHGPEDFSATDTVLKRSTDGGRTWGEDIKVVASGPPNTRTSGVPVIDRLNNGRIVMVVVQIELPDESYRAFVLHSDDDGATWQKREDWLEITDLFSNTGWNHYVVGPSQGIQLQSERHHPGRLLFACWHKPTMAAHTIYSDDHGATWHIGGMEENPTGNVTSGETAVVELEDGTVYLNTRNQRGNTADHRADTTSSDGGASLDSPYTLEPSLVTPIVHGSLVEAKRTDDSSERIVFCAPGHASSRERLSLWSSLDGAQSWRKSLLVHDGPAGYSDMVKLSDSHLGVAYETGPRLPEIGGGLVSHERIDFARVQLSALDQPLPPRVTVPDGSGNGNDGIVGGTPTLVSGRHGRALSLAGDYFEVPLNDELTVGTGAFTAALWFRTTTGDLQVLANGYNFAERPKWKIDLTGQRVRGTVRTDQTSRAVSARGNFADGNWHHVALRRGGRDAVTLYVDGVPTRGDGPARGSVSEGSFAPIRVGCRVDGINRPYIGAVDDFVFYTRGVGDNEIAAQAGGKSPNADDSYLKVYLRCGSLH